MCQIEVTDGDPNIAKCYLAMQHMQSLEIVTSSHGWQELAPIFKRTLNHNNNCTSARNNSTRGKKENGAWKRRGSHPGVSVWQKCGLCAVLIFSPFCFNSFWQADRDNLWDSFVLSFGRVGLYPRIEDKKKDLQNTSISQKLSMCCTIWG